MGAPSTRRRLRMLFLVLAVVCSVLVSVLLKLFPRHHIDMPQALCWSYAIASALAWLLLDPSLQALAMPRTPWPAIAVLAILLPSLFVVLARSVDVAGIVRSDVAQRLSLLLSLAAAFVFFGERANGWKLAGLAMGLAAVLAIAVRPRADDASTGWRDAAPWLLAVWAGFACVDILLKRIAAAGTPSLTSLAVCFTLAFALTALWNALRLWRARARLAQRHAIAGLLLGALNFGNILFYVRAHQALPHSPATVFATMNIGVVALGALVGTAGFGERVGWPSRIGLLLAVLAIGLIAWGTLAG